MNRVSETDYTFPPNNVISNHEADNNVWGKDANFFGHPAELKSI